MKIATQKSKPSNKARVQGLMLILTVLLLVFGCSNQITKAETAEPMVMQMHSLSNDIYWFVESFDDGNTRNDPGLILLQYLEEQGDNLCIEALEQFINENIGHVEIIIDQEDAEETEHVLADRIKEKTTIKLANGSTLIIVRF